MEQEENWVRAERKRIRKYKKIVLSFSLSLSPPPTRTYLSDHTFYLTPPGNFYYYFFPKVFLLSLCESIVHHVLAGHRLKVPVAA